MAELMVSDKSDFASDFSDTNSALQEHPANDGKQGLGLICMYSKQRCFESQP